MNAAIAQLLHHYGVRLAALALCRRGDGAAALAALRGERDAAVATLRADIGMQRHQALAGARRRARLLRLALLREGALHPSPPHPLPQRPARIRRRAGKPIGKPRTGPCQSSP